MTKFDLVRNGRVLAVWRAAVPGGPPALLLHGVTYSSRSVFDLAVPGHPREEYSLMRALAGRGHDIYALDFAGYGLSDDDPAADLSSHVADTAHVLAAIESRTGRKPALVGWSWGAQVAAALANRHPTALRRLVFWGSFWGGGTAGRPAPMAAMTAPSDRRRLNTPEHAAADFVTPANYEESVRHSFVRQALRIDPTSPVVGRVEVAAGVPLHDPTGVRVPILIVYGADDPMAIPADLAEYLDRVPHPDKAVVRIPDSDHNTQFGRGRRRLADALDSFLGLP